MKRHSDEVLNKLMSCEPQKSCDVKKLFRKKLYSEFKRDKKNKAAEEQDDMLQFHIFSSDTSSIKIK